MLCVGQNHSNSPMPLVGRGLSSLAKLSIYGYVREGNLLSA